MSFQASGGKARIGQLQVSGCGGVRPLDPRSGQYRWVPEAPDIIRLLDPRGGETLGLRVWGYTSVGSQKRPIPYAVVASAEKMHDLPSKVVRFTMIHHRLLWVSHGFSMT